jgi:FkbM family methyltransferase
MRAIFPDSKEKELLEHFFKGSIGYFVEVGANDPVFDSKTWNLEQLGWTGLLIEPQPELAQRLKATRKASVGCFACGSPSQHQTTMTLHIAGDYGGHSSLNPDHFVAGSCVTSKIEVPVVTLESALRHHNPPRPIDLLAIDTEGFDLEVLDGIDLAYWRPRLILIEDMVLHLGTHRYLTERGYRWIGRSGLNGWYVPAADAPRIGPVAWLQFVRKYYLGLPFRILRERSRRMRARKTQGWLNFRNPKARDAAGEGWNVSGGSTLPDGTLPNCESATRSNSPSIVPIFDHETEVPSLSGNRRETK